MRGLTVETRASSRTGRRRVPLRGCGRLRLRGGAGAVLVCLLAALPALSGCGQASSVPPGGTPAPSSASSGAGSGDATTAEGPQATGPRTTGPTTPSEADRLEPFFAAAARADRQLQAAAAKVNAGIGSTSIVIDASTGAAVDAVDLLAVGRAIPGGLPPALLTSLLQVYADLSTRLAALEWVPGFGNGKPVARSSAEGKRLLSCLGNGAAPAAWFGDDLAAARRLAAHTAPITAAPQRSRAAAEVAIRTFQIHKDDRCAATCGAGQHARHLRLGQLVWKPVRDTSGALWDGILDSENGMLFMADYLGGQGWAIHVNYC